MSELGDSFREYNLIRKEKRTFNRLKAPLILEESGVTFISKNSGAHLIVSYNGSIVDFWPGTGKWIFRDKELEGRGIFNLLDKLQNNIANYNLIPLPEELY